MPEGCLVSGSVWGGGAGGGRESGLVLPHLLVAQCNCDVTIENSTYRLSQAAQAGTAFALFKAHQNLPSLRVGGSRIRERSEVGCGYAGGCGCWSPSWVLAIYIHHHKSLPAQLDAAKRNEMKYLPSQGLSSYCSCK